MAPWLSDIPGGRCSQLPAMLSGLLSLGAPAAGAHYPEGHTQTPHCLSKGTALLCFCFHLESLSRVPVTAPRPTATSGSPAVLLPTGQESGCTRLLPARPLH